MTRHPTEAVMILQLQLACDDANTRLIDFMDTEIDGSDEQMAWFQKALKVRREDMLNRVETLMDGLLSLGFKAPQYKQRYYEDCLAFLRDWQDITEPGHFPCMRRICALWAEDGT